MLIVLAIPQLAQAVFGSASEDNQRKVIQALITTAPGVKYIMFELSFNHNLVL